MAFNLNQSITRESAFPLDSREKFTNITLANNAKPGLYAGQKISIVPDNGIICHYTVDNDNSKTLKPLINAASGNLITASVSADGTINNLIGTFKDLYIGGDSYNVKTQIDNKALNSITITAGNGLTGGGDLTENRTLNVGAGNGITVSTNAVSAKAGNGITVDATGINHADTSSQESVSANGRKYITAVTLDTYGHVTGLTTGTESLEQAKLFTTTESGTANAATTNGGTYLRLFNGTVHSTNTKIQGSGATTVTSDTNGTITIKSEDTHNKHKINSGKNSAGNDILSANDSDSNIILGDSGVTASSYGEASAKTLTSNGNFKIPYITVNSKGIVTSVSNKTMTMPEIGGSGGDDVKFSKDFTFSEPFGKYSTTYNSGTAETSGLFGGTSNGKYTLKTSGKSLEELLSNAFSKETAASFTAKIGSSTTSYSTSVEYGTSSVTLNASYSFNAGTSGTSVSSVAYSWSSGGTGSSKSFYNITSSITGTLTATATLSNNDTKTDNISYTITPTYYPYYMTNGSTNSSLSNITSGVTKTTNSNCSTNGVSITLTQNAYIWFFMPPSTTGSKTIQYEALGSWYDVPGGTSGPTTVTLKLDSSTSSNTVSVSTYKAYRTVKTVDPGTIKFRIV